MPALPFASTCAVCLLLLISCNNQQKTGRLVLPEIAAITAEEMLPREEIRLHEYNNAFIQLATQHFTVPPERVTVITAARGFMVTLDPSILEKENGKPVDGPVHVGIIELNNSEELFKSNAATVSNGRLLASGGSYFIGMDCNGQKLRIRKGQRMQVCFPVLKNEEMELFYGARDSLSNMNWQRAGSYLREPEESIFFADNNPLQQSALFGFSEITGHVFRSMNDAVYYYDKKITLAALLDTVNKTSAKLCVDTISFWPRSLPVNRVLDTNYLVQLYGPRFQFLLKSCLCKEEEKEELEKWRKLAADTVENTGTLTLAEQIQKRYAPSGISRLGWINVDRYYRGEPPTDITADLPITFNNSRIEYFVVFKKFNGLLKGSVLVNEQSRVSIRNLPANEEVTLVAFTKSKGQLYHSSTELRTGEELPVPIRFKAISVGEMNKIFGRNARI